MWYGQWRTRGRLVKRKLGLKREPGTRNGLKRAQAERELRRPIESEVPHHPRDRRLTLEEAGYRFIQHLEAVGRTPSTLVAYRSALRVHLVPYFGDGPFDAVSPEDVEGFMSAMRRQGLSSKSIRNYVGILGTLYAHWERRALIERNPVRQSTSRPGSTALTSAGSISRNSTRSSPQRPARTLSSTGRSS